MTALGRDDRVVNPDDLYQALVDAHDDLTEPESRQLSARLILLLANHVGDLDAVREAATTARASVLADRD